jgi:aspartate kinase
MLDLHTGAGGTTAAGIGESAALLDLLDERHVAGKQLHVFADRTTLVISRENLHDEPRLRESLDSRFGTRVRLLDGLAAVSVVGAGINSSYANVRRGSDALTAGDIAASGISTSSFRITWMVPRETMQDAVRRLHHVFIEAVEMPVPLEDA